MKIYHLVPKNAWQKAKEVGFYAPESLEKESFIHCSTKEQVLPTANRRYIGESNLVLLVINTKKVDAKIVFEDTSDRGEKHPHIYGRLPLVAVEVVQKMKLDTDGEFIFSDIL